MTKEQEQTQTKSTWFAIRAYSGHEDKVVTEIRRRLTSFNLDSYVEEILIPREKQVELKNGKRQVIEKLIFKGYILIKVNLTDEVWFVIRNTPSVSGFVGASGRPIPISEKEIKRIKQRMVQAEPKHKIDYRPGEIVLVTDGPFRDQEGSIAEVDVEKGRLKVLINVLGRDTPMDLDALQVRRL